MTDYRQEVARLLSAMRVLREDNDRLRGAAKEPIAIIGLSARTNESGAGQLAAHLVDLGYRADIVDIRPCGQLLHLKTGIAWLGDGRLLATGDVPDFPELAAYEILRVPDAERYAANALRVNDRVLVAAGYPATRAAVESLGFPVIEVEMSEFRKLDGGLSCLSLRWQ